YRSISPALPVISTGGLAKTIGGTSNFNVTVSGTDLDPNSLYAWVDGSKQSLQVNATSSGLNAVGTIDANHLNDGVHTLLLTVAQSDGLSSSFTTSFSTNAQVSSLNRTVQLETLAIGGVAIIALLLGVFALRRRKVPQTPPTPSGWHV
ncbi:MAG TPA: hypothetical protein VIW22_00685, partial [Nitrososphaerales archaeon]